MVAIGRRCARSLRIYPRMALCGRIRRPISPTHNLLSDVARSGYWSIRLVPRCPTASPLGRTIRSLSRDRNHVVHAAVRGMYPRLVLPTLELGENGLPNIFLPPQLSSVSIWRVCPSYSTGNEAQRGPVLPRQTSPVRLA